MIHEFSKTHRVGVLTHSDIKGALPLIMTTYLPIRINFASTVEARINKSKPIESHAKKTRLPEAAIENALTVSFDLITKSVKKREDITLVGLETFTQSKRRAVGRNPQTGKEIKKPAIAVPRFRPGKENRDLLC